MLILWSYPTVIHRSSDEGTITEGHVFSLYSDRGILFSIYTLDDIIIQFHCIVFEYYYIYNIFSLLYVGLQPMS
jgi:hypothetical protein